METSQALPFVTVAPVELAALVRRPGPFATVYLTVDAEIDNAEQRSQQRWKTVRAELIEQGTPEDVLASIDPLVPDAHLQGQCLTVIVAPDGHRHVEYQPDPPTTDIGRWSTLPALGPLLEWRQQTVPHVVVLIDRRGADLLAFTGERSDAIEHAGGSDDPITKSAPGGWSQARYQRRAENSWDENADDVAAALTHLVENTRARLVVVAGDVRAVQLLRGHLTEAVDELVHVVDGGRSPDGSSDAIAAEATRLAATVAAADSRALLEKFREARGQHEHAADGVAATVAALNEARVEVLLVPGDLDRTDSGWFGAEPIPVALSPDTLQEMGVEHANHGPLVDVLIRAAFGTGAGVRIIPSHAAPSDGVGALLRW